MKAQFLPEHAATSFTGNASESIFLVPALSAGPHGAPMTGNRLPNTDTSLLHPSLRYGIIRLPELLSIADPMRHHKMYSFFAATTSDHLRLLQISRRGQCILQRCGLRALGKTRGLVSGAISRWTGQTFRRSGTSTMNVHFMVAAFQSSISGSIRSR